MNDAAPRFSQELLKNTASTIVSWIPVLGVIVLDSDLETYWFWVLVFVNTALILRIAIDRLVTMNRLEAHADLQQHLEQCQSLPRAYSQTNQATESDQYERRF